MVQRRQDLTGKVFGKLTVMEFSHKNQRRECHWKCLCECGKETVVRSNQLTSGRTRSCGCLQKEVTIQRQTTHGMHDTRIYRIWNNMKMRCINVKAPYYSEYGGRGITLCKDWEDFSLFYRDMGESYQDGLEIDRIDVDKGYCKENCRWATRAEQNRNRRDTVRLTYKGITKPAIDWAEEKGLTIHAIKKRIKNGWTVEKILETPLGAPSTLQKYYTYKDRTDWTLTELAEVSEVSRGTLKRRLQQGWKLELAVTTPIIKHRRKGKPE